MRKKICVILLLLPIVFGFDFFKKKEPIVLTPEEKTAAESVSLSVERALELKGKKLYEFTPADVNDYLGYLQVLLPDIRDRVVHLAKKGIGQPYQIYLLGEFPFELYDKDPLYRLDKSDCLVFTEHIYAMSLAKDWPQFFSFLQRIRYVDGEITTTRRNHSTIPTWINSNKWLVQDVTEEIAPGLTKPIKFKFNPNSEIISDYGLDPKLPTEDVETSYIPLENIDKILDKLEPGSFVNVIRGFEEPNLWCSHVGFVSKNEAGQITFLDSSVPTVRERPFTDVVKWCYEFNERAKKNNSWVDEVKKNPSLLKAKKKYFIFKQEPEKPKKTAYHFGYKFYNIQPDPFKLLIDIDGPDAPKVTGPRGLLLHRKDVPAKK